MGEENQQNVPDVYSENEVYEGIYDGKVDATESLQRLGTLESINHITENDRNTAIQHLIDEGKITKDDIITYNNNATVSNNNPFNDDNKLPIISIENFDFENTKTDVETQELGSENPSGGDTSNENATVSDQTEGSVLNENSEDGLPDLSVDDSLVEPQYGNNQGTETQTSSETKSGVVGTKLLSTWFAESRLKDLFYNRDDSEKFKDYLKNRSNDLESICSCLNGIIGITNQLNTNTAEKLKSKLGDNLDDYLENLKSRWKEFQNTIDSQYEVIEAVDNALDSQDNASGGSGNANVSSIKGNSSRSHSSSSSSTNTSNTVEIIESTENIITSTLVSSIVGAITFKEIVPLYSTIGTSSTQSASLTGNYGLLGVVNENGKYYYKIIDKDTNSVYYVEIDDKANIGDFSQVLEIKEPETMLTSTEIGSNNFYKLTESNTCYLVQGEVENNDIKFVNVSENGNSYYIPLSDSVNLTTIDNLISINAGGNNE